jgi:hypothetical protein
MILGAALLLGQGAQAAAGWSGFYTPSARNVARALPTEERTPPQGLCVREILKAQLRHRIPGNLLLGIGLQESGTRRDGNLTIWPWTVNAEGEGRLFDTRQAALDWVLERRAAGVASIDVGCLQVNLRWHPDAFDNLDEGFDAARNVDYAARFLRSLYEEKGDWVLAAGSYHSATPDRQEDYLTSLRQNVAVANERIDAFRTLAALAEPGEPAPRKVVQTPPLTGGFWTAHLGAQDGAPRRSLYSRAPLRPVLPQFRGAASDDGQVE